jgi:hypothetical protein
MRFCLLVLFSVCFVSFDDTATAAPPDTVINCYLPIEGGWHIRITDDPTKPCLKPGEAIGVAVDPRVHRRALFPPADRTLVWTKEALAKRERTAFRSLIIAGNEPRFVFDLDIDGGISSHLLLGLRVDQGPSKWLHQFNDIDVRYVDGRMEYVLQDASFPGITVRLTLLPLAESVGLLMKFRVEGATQPGELVWVYGGASNFNKDRDHADCYEYRYSPEQCNDNMVRWEKGRFAILRGGVAVVRGGGSLSEGTGFGDPKAVLESPAAVCASAQWCSATDAAEEAKRVALQEVRVGKEPVEGWIVAGRGGNIEECLADPQKAEQAARARNRSIADRIVVQSPDPYLNQAMPMLAFSTEGIWGDVAFLHGGWSWRLPYLGWRGWYGPMCYGWTDRVKHSIEQHSTLGLIREGPDQGALGHMLEQPGALGYNMNEVFLDQARQYFDYTDDVELMRKIFPVLKGIVEWEARRLQPTSVPLYESSLNTWISDSHWYIRGQCTTASAYMLGAYRFLAEVAEALGEDPAPYRNRSQEIRNAMQQNLWQPRRGVFAEYLDTLGAKQLHPEPELATIYHSAEFQAVEPLQVYEMLHWADNHLRCESTAGGGRAYWNSNWYPNSGRSYTHSTYDLAYAEQLNLAMAHFQIGRADEGYALLRGAICGIYNGCTPGVLDCEGSAPGGLSCQMCVDGRQRRNSEFADAVSMWGRAVVEGMYGIRPKRSRGIVELAPQFPNTWAEASIQSPRFAYRWTRQAGKIVVEWESPVATAVELRLPLQAKSVEEAAVDGKATDYRLEPGVGLTWLSLTTSSAVRGEISVSYVPAEIIAPQPVTWKEGDRAELKLADFSASSILDPQSVLDDVRIEDAVLQGTVAGEPGMHVLFFRSGTEACPFWLPLTARIESRQPAPKKTWSPPVVKANDPTAWTMIDLTKAFNASVTEVLSIVAQASQPQPPPALDVNRQYWKDHITTRLDPKGLSDAAWRQKIDSKGVGWTHDGIPFMSSQKGKNIAVVTRAGGFPEKIEIPFNATGKELYLMLTGITFPAQSHVVNVRVTLDYADEPHQQADLVNPFDIGDCWGTWLGRYHDTAANGFENLGGRIGPPGSSAAGDLSRPISVDTEAHLVKIPLRQGVDLRSLSIEAVANDAIFGLMGASVLK